MEKSQLQKWVGIAALLLALAVAFGAFGAHGLKGYLDAYSLEVYHKAVFYHFIHALGILLITLLLATDLILASIGRKILYLLTFGVVIFSGSLYVLALTGLKWLGAITPFGGTAFIFAWSTLAYSSLRRSR